MTIRRLSSPADVPVFQKLRLEALTEAPEAFASTYADWVDLPDTEWARRLAESPTWAAFEGALPIGLMGYMRERPARNAHRALLVMVYVSPSARGHGVGRRMLAAVLDGARGEGIIQMELGVAADNRDAIALYEAAGFRHMGRIPDAFHSDGRFSDEERMYLRLDDGKA